MKVKDNKGREYNLEKGLDYEGYPMLKVFHLDQQRVVWIKRDGFYSNLNRMIQIGD